MRKTRRNRLTISNGLGSCRAARAKQPGAKVTRRGIAAWLVLGLCASLWAAPANAQLIDPQGSMILSVLREISFKHQLGLDEQRRQTAKLVQQLKQFYDSYTLLRQDFEFTQSLYRDFQSIKNMRITNSFAVSNFILNGDRFDYWFPNTAQELSRSTMDTDALLHNADALRRVYDSFALSTQDEEAPKDAELRRQNALIGQEAFSRALLQQALRDKKLAQSYDSMAVELYHQVINAKNKYTEAERTQLLVESVKLRDLSNQHYEKYLKLSQEVNANELNMYDQKLEYLRSKTNWRNLKKEVNKISRIRYGFFDITPVQFK